MPFRANRAGPRPARPNQNDHDILEGIPVRHWRKRTVQLKAESQKGRIDGSTGYSPPYGELPLPKEFSLLPEESQQLLRAARLGVTAEILKKAQKKQVSDDTQAVNGISGHSSESLRAPRWTLVPRDQERPEPEYLARLPDGSNPYHTNISASGVPMRRIKVRRIDAQGADIVCDVLKPEGMEIEGEVSEDQERSVPVTTLAAGTVVEGLGIVNHDGVIIAGDPDLMSTPLRRRPAVPRKRKGGPGRGRKKKLASSLETSATISASKIKQEGESTADGNPNESQLELADAQLSANASDKPQDREEIEQDDESGDDEEDDEDDDDDENDNDRDEDGEMAAASGEDEGKSQVRGVIESTAKPSDLQMQTTQIPGLVIAKDRTVTDSRSLATETLRDDPPRQMQPEIETRTPISPAILDLPSQKTLEDVDQDTFKDDDKSGDVQVDPESMPLNGTGESNGKDRPIDAPSSVMPIDEKKDPKTPESAAFDLSSEADVDDGAIEVPAEPIPPPKVPVTRSSRSSARIPGLGS